jgi:hypothetical protein
MEYISRRKSDSYFPVKIIMESKGKVFPSTGLGGP